DPMSALLRKFRTVARIAGNVTARLTEPIGLVLLYHRVTNLQDDPQSLAVKPENFRAHITYLRDRCRLVPFDEIGDNLERGTVSVAITFDDGYADNFIEAAPIIESIGVPVTFFITTQHIGSDREFWW